MTGPDRSPEEWRREDATRPPALADGVLHLWLTPLAAASADAAVLASEEQERASRFHFERDRMRFIAGRVWVRHILSAYVGEAPAELSFRANEHGKPALDLRDAPAFNFSRSDGWGLLAVAREGPIGADIEAPHAIGDADAVARDNFSESEQAKLIAVPTALRNDVFYRIWTRKEAVVKALGQGLTAPLKAFSVSASETDAAILDTEAAAWEARGLQLTALSSHGLVGAVATPFSPRAVLRFVAGDPPKKG